MVSSVSDTDVPSEMIGLTLLVDVYPEDDNVTGGGKVDFVGTWSSYALFKSGYILVNTMERGAFVLKMQAGATA